MRRTLNSFLRAALPGRFLLKLGLCIITVILLYLMAIVTGTLIPANASFTPDREGTTIYVTTNGFHTDLTLPIRNQREDCFRVLAEENSGQSFSQYHYVSFGWGDRDFYLSSYENAFPSAGTILDALFVPGESLMHVTFYHRAPQLSTDVKSIRLSDAQYQRLVQFISGSFREEEGRLVRLNQPGYGPNDFFYEAQGKYHLFQTCNAWTGAALREAGVKVSWWTPLESCVFFYLP